MSRLSLHWSVTTHVRGGVKVVVGGVEPPPPPPPHAVNPASAKPASARSVKRLKEHVRAEPVRSRNIVLSPFPASSQRLDSGCLRGQAARATVTLKVRSVSSAGFSGKWNVTRPVVAPWRMVTIAGSSV